MSLSVEYGRWKLMDGITTKISKGLDNKQKYEMSNILERWILTLMNNTNGVLQQIPNNHPVNRKAVAELKEKHLPINRAQFENTVVQSVNAFVKRGVKIVRGRCTLTDSEIKYIDFVKFIGRKRSELLKKYKKKDVVRCALRYGLVISKGQQWAVPTAQYDLLYAKYNVRNEGFASPFNSRMMGRRNGKFCSLFPDTDAVFGSIGNFFDTRMTGGWAVNPPYIDSLLVGSAKHVLKNMQNKEKLFVFYIMPGWFDSAAYSLLKKSKYCRRVEVLNKYKHFYEHGDDTVVAKFNSIVFILDNFSKSKYEGIVSLMKIHPKVRR